MHRPNCLSTLRVAVLAAACILLLPHALAQQVPWKTQASDDAMGLSDAQTPAAASPAEMLAQLARRPHASRVVVTFDGPLSDAQRAALADSGVTLLSYLSHNAYFARVDAARLDTQRVANLGVLKEAAAINTLNKVHPILAQAIVPDWAQVDVTPEDDPIIGAYVVFHRDVDLNAEAPAVVELRDGVVRDFLESINGLVVELPLSAAFDLAADDAVQWVEPALPRMSETNNSNRGITQAGTAQAAPYNLDGTGVTVLVYDGGTVYSSHVDYGGRAHVRDSSGLASHATHVGGTIGGDGTASSGTYRGMAPNVTIESYGFEYDGSAIFLYTNPGDLEDDYDEAINTYGADLSNNSIGTNTETNGFMCTYQGDYGACSQLIDAIVRGSLGAPFRVVWANGNERQGNVCDVEGYGDYYSTAPPAGAKNHITVGALNSNDDSMTSFSSWGPVNDGRIKPDISAPGCQSNDDGGVTSLGTSSTTAYAVACGTSMASPTVTGLCALLLEDFRAQYPAASDPRNSTMKCFLAHAAVDRGNTGPDYQFGYGSVRIVDSIDLMRTGHFTEDTVSQNSTVEYSVTVGGGTGELKLTMAWDDYPGAPNVNPALVNDLDLVVLDPVGGRHYPWTLDPFNPSAAAVQTQEDHVNNIEQVRVTSPMAGTWTVRVVGTDVPEGPQPFSLVASTALTDAGLRIVLPNGVPSEMTPGTAASFTVEIDEVSETLVGTPQLHFRYDGGTYLTQTLASLGGNQYQATLPGAICGATPEFYVSAVGNVSGTVTSPAAAPTDVFSADVGTDNVVLNDNFETGTGWTVTNTSLSDGPWTRGVPVGLGDRGDPPQDYDGSGACWLTDNVYGNSDVDGGPTTLTSPTYALASMTNPVLSVALWFANDDYDIDTLTVEFSSNGGSSWTTADSMGNTGGWILREYDISAYATNNFKVRFQATDNPNDSVTEAAVDRLRIAERICTATLDDCNGNGIEDTSEIATGVATDNNSNGIPDDCDPGCPDADGDGVCDPNDVCPGFDDNVDTDGDGVPDGCDICPGGDDGIDSDGDGVPDACDICPGGDDNVDTDGDGVPDFCDICAGGDDNVDSDGDGVPDFCDVCPGSDDGIDSDGDGVPDGCDICAGGDDNVDTDGDGVPDFCDICPGGDDNVDSDGDTVPDFCDVCPGGDDTIDSDHDGIPDACECVGDLDNNGVVDLTDLGILLGNYGLSPADPADGDLNDDDVIDLTDLGLLLGNYGSTCP